MASTRRSSIGSWRILNSMLISKKSWLRADWNFSMDRLRRASLIWYLSKSMTVSLFPAIFLDNFYFKSDSYLSKQRTPISMREVVFNCPEKVVEEVKRFWKISEKRFTVTSSRSTKMVQKGSKHWCIISGKVETSSVCYTIAKRPCQRNNKWKACIPSGPNRARQKKPIIDSRLPDFF